MTKKDLTIGRLAKKSDVNVETIRYYQRIGLIEEPAKPAQGYRLYPAGTVDRVRFIKRAQVLGFSLNEITPLLGLSDGKHCADTEALARKKLTTVEQKIADLAAIKKTLADLIAHCSEGSRGYGCPIIDTLANDEVAK